MMSTLKVERSKRTAQRAAAALLVFLSGVGAVFAAESPLNVCADPDNLPFSSSTGTPKGFYIDLADRLAAALGRVPEQVWQPTYLGKRAVRIVGTRRPSGSAPALPSRRHPDPPHVSRQSRAADPAPLHRRARHHRRGCEGRDRTRKQRFYRLVVTKRARVW